MKKVNNNNHNNNEKHRSILMSLLLRKRLCKSHSQREKTNKLKAFNMPNESQFFKKEIRKKEKGKKRKYFCQQQSFENTRISHQYLYSNSQIYAIICSLEASSRLHSSSLGDQLSAVSLPQFATRDTVDPILCGQRQQRRCAFLTLCFEFDRAPRH